LLNAWIRLELIYAFQVIDAFSIRFASLIELTYLGTMQDECHVIYDRTCVDISLYVCRIVGTNGTVKRFQSSGVSKVPSNDYAAPHIHNDLDTTHISTKVCTRRNRPACSTKDSKSAETRCVDRSSHHLTPTLLTPNTSLTRYAIDRYI
jgi:hypothetical protein